MKEHGQQIMVSRPRRKKKGQRETAGVVVITGSKDPTIQVGSSEDAEVVAGESRFAEATTVRH